jgi:SAM-dependent methyltransferase
MPFLIIFLVSAVTLGLEILLTNVFSIALFSSHGAVAIALALLGVAAGGALGFVEGAIDPERWRRRMFYLLVLLAAAVVSSIWGLLQIEFVPNSVTYWRYFSTDNFLASGKLYYAIPIAFMPFLISGYLQVGIFKNDSERFGKLYGADLVGATVGAIAFQLLLYPIGLKGVAVAMGVTLLIPAFLIVLQDRKALRITAFAASAVVIGALAGSETFKVRYCAGQSTWIGQFGHLMEEIWTPLARIALVQRGDGAQSYVVNNSFATYAANTTENLASYSREIFSVPVQAKSGGDVLVIASGGGPGIIMANRFGARSIDAVEIADGVVNHIVRDRADDPNNPYLLDGVEYHVADARSFIMRAEKPYDLILLRTVEGFSATGQLASAWSTNFITSQEAVQEYLGHLAPDGVFAFATAAYPGSPTDWVGKDPLSHAITQVRIRSLTAGLELAGVEDPLKNLMILKQENWFLYLVKRTPFTPMELRRYLTIAADLPPALGRDGNLVRVSVAFPEVVGLEGLPENIDPDPRLAGAVADVMKSTEPIGISALSASLDPVAEHPLSDDRPYKFKSGLLDFSGSGFEYILGDSYRKLVGIVLALALLFVALPFLMKRRLMRSGDSRPDGRLAAIAVLTGFGFMFIEMASMFRFQLYLHHPTIAMIVVLSSMICGAGLGSMHSAKVAPTSKNVRLFSNLSVLLSVLLFLAPLVLHSSLLALPFLGAVAVLFFAFLGLGYLLGHVVPLSISTFGGGQPRTVAWCWAVTVTFSVFGSILSAILTRSAGVTLVAVLGIACYVLISLTLAISGEGRDGGQNPQGLPS